MNKEVVTVFGGSGFVGRYIVRQLAKAGYRIRIAVRDCERANFLKTSGDIGQIIIVPTSVNSEKEVSSAIEGARFVVNAVGILYEQRTQKFGKIHSEGAARIARISRVKGVEKLILLSAIGAHSGSNSLYARTKAEGEQLVLKEFPTATILRPSVIFGPEDKFLNLFANIIRASPVVPYFAHAVPHAEGGGGTKFQPVYVGDIAEATKRLLKTKSSGGRVYELGGPEVICMRDILDLIRRYSARSCYIICLPFWLASIQAFFMQFLPSPILTIDQVKLLKIDNIISGELPGLNDLGIEPTPMKSIIPSYLNRFRPFQENKILRNISVTKSNS
jgi:uncharacterized protein YbjT (DUF2867 family)